MRSLSAWMLPVTAVQEGNKMDDVCSAVAVQLRGLHVGGGVAMLLAHLLGRRPMGRGLVPSKEPLEFAPTIWSRIERAKAGDAAARDEVYWLYRRPVERFMERNLTPGAEVEELADDVMRKVLDPEFLRTKSRDRGRFRDLLYAVARNYMNNYRRRPDYRNRFKDVRLDDVGDLGPPTQEERQDFDRFYAREVYEAAHEAFRKESEERESPEARVLDLYYRGGLRQEEIAERLGLTVAATNTHLDRGRKRLRKHFLAVLATVSRNEGELQDEAKQLLAILSRRRPAPGSGGVTDGRQ